MSGTTIIAQISMSMLNGRLIKVESIAECSPWSILQYFLLAFLSGGLRQVFLYNHQYMHTSVCDSV